MSKEFEKFWNKDNNFEMCRTTEQFCKVSWDACKEEILKIINNSIVHSMPEDEDYEYSYYLDKDNLINKIEEL